MTYVVIAIVAALFLGVADIFRNGPSPALVIPRQRRARGVRVGSVSSLFLAVAVAVLLVGSGAVSVNPNPTPEQPNLVTVGAPNNGQ